MESSSCSLFPFQMDEEISIINFPEFTTIWDVGLDHVSYPAGLPPNLAEVIDFEGHGKGKTPKKLEEIKDGAANQDQVKKKILHREVERQRRQELTTLYASLRSVLPAHHIKGKRSTSDQIDEAAKYIRYMQNNVRELGMKRDNLKRLRNINESLGSKEGSSSKPVLVTVQTCSVGIEVLITSDLMAEGLILPLSRILQLLLEQGLVAVCCNSTKSDGVLHYMIQSKVLHNPGIDIQMLQRKLTCMINLYSS